MIRWPAFFALATALQAAEGWLRAGGRAALPDVAALLVLFCGLCARDASLPGLALLLAMSRAPLTGAGLWPELARCGAMILLMLPLRRLFSWRDGVWLAVSAALVVGMLHLAQTGGARGPGSVWPRLLTTAIAAPILLRMLHRLPPGAWFAAERW